GRKMRFAGGLRWTAPSLSQKPISVEVEMEDELADKIENLRNTRIICRSGDQTDLYDINIVNPNTSRSIIVLSPEGDHADSEVIKT
ncbi:hypothetical protein ACCS72_37990, partial [Rhizobium ruizarguesonis]